MSWWEKPVNQSTFSSHPKCKPKGVAVKAWGNDRLAWLLHQCLFYTSHNSPPWLLYPVFPCYIFVTYESECGGQSRWAIWISVWIPLWKHLFNLAQTEVKLHTPLWSKNGCDKVLMSDPLCSQTQLLFLLLWNTEESNEAPEKRFILWKESY